MFPEAELVSALDTLDATLYEMTAALENVGEGQFTGKVWGLDRKLYRHAFAGRRRGSQARLSQAGTQLSAVRARHWMD